MRKVGRCTGVEGPHLDHASSVSAVVVPEVRDANLFRDGRHGQVLTCCFEPKRRKRSAVYTRQASTAAVFSVCVEGSLTRW